MTRLPDSESADGVRIESEDRPVEIVYDIPPDPRVVIEDLRRRLREEQEKTLNSTDAVMGARAAAAQAKAETQDVYYRLHVRETELAQLKELVAEMGRGGTGERSGRANGEEGDGGTPPPPAEAARMLLASVKRAVSER